MPNSPSKLFYHDQFLPHLSEDLCELVGSPDDLDIMLEEIIQNARQAWPDIKLDAAVYLAHLANHLPEDTDVQTGLIQLRTVDLYLACACIQGDQRSIHVFERHCLPGVKANLHRMSMSSLLIDEVLQLLRHKLLVGTETTEPKLQVYRGRSSLRSWVRVTAVRLALDTFRCKHMAEDSLDDDQLLDLTHQRDEELEFLKQIYNKEFKEVFYEALATLTSRERNLLRRQLLDGLNIEEIGSMYQVHRATAARWIERIRNKLLTHTRRSLKERLDLNRAEFTSLVRLVISQFNPSLRRILSEDESGETVSMTPPKAPPRSSSED